MVNCHICTCNWFLLALVNIVSKIFNKIRYNSWIHFINNTNKIGIQIMNKKIDSCFECQIVIKVWSRLRWRNRMLKFHRCICICSSLWAIAFKRCPAEKQCLERGKTTKVRRNVYDSCTRNGLIAINILIISFFLMVRQLNLMIFSTNIILFYECIYT